MDKQKGFLEESLAQSQGKDVCRALFDGSPDAIFLGDPETGIILDANPAAERLLGRPISEIIGLHQTALHPPRRETASRRIFNEHSAADSRVVGNGPEGHYALRADGTEIPIEITAKIIKIKGRKVLQGFFRDVSERKRTEEALKESEQKFRVLTEKSIVGIYLIQDGLIKYANPVLTALFGYTPGEAFNKLTPKELVLAEDWQLVEGNLRKRLGGEECPANYVFRGVKKTGEVIYVDALGTRIDYLGRPAIIGTMMDVTERKRSQEALRESEERYRTLVDHAPIGIVVHHDRKIRFVNHRIGELGGVEDTTEFIGSDVLDLVHQNSKAEAARRINVMMNNDSALPAAEMKTIAPNGRVFDMEVLSIRIPYQGEDCIMSIFQDITERKSAEKELLHAEETLRTLINSMPDIVCFKDGGGRWMEANTFDLHLFGLEGVNYRGKKDSELAEFSPFYRDSFIGCEESDEAAWRKGVTSRGEEMIPRSDGKTFIFDIIKVPVFNPDGSRKGLIVVGRDISDLKRAEAGLKSAHSQLLKANTELEKRVEARTAQLAELNKELEAFSYSAAHDMKAPLRRINIFAELLEKEAGPDLKEEQRANIGIIHKSVMHMMNLVEGLLTLSTTGRKPLENEPVNLAELLGEVLSDIKAENPDRKIEWHTQILPLVKCDKAMLKQVFINLLGNAVKYTQGREPAVIKVSYENKGGEHVIGVSDNGVGFSMEYSDKVFGVFQRLHKSEEFSGTGIGLSIVKRIIARHGGRVWAESEENKGAIFYFTLPSP